jgi:hypothetical protein
MIRSIALPFGSPHPDLGGRDVFHSRMPFEISPFLVMSDFRMTGPVFPPHPHAGFSVATYILPESPVGFWNQDTLGNVNPITPGSVHWTVAGAGVMHEETVARSGQAALGLQIWIDHPADRREMPPAALHLTADRMPVVAAPGLSRRQVFGGMAPLALPVQAALADVTAAPGATWTEDVLPGHAAWAYLHGGAVDIGGEVLPAGHAVALPSGTRIVAGPAGARVMLFSGLPTGARPLHRGPFVGSDKAMLDRFSARFETGGMGRLTPFDQAALDRQHDAGVAARQNVS